MESIDIAKNVIKSCLQLGDQVNSFDEGTQLLGDFAEVNSLTIVTMITSIEEQLDVEISDAELSGEIFESVGSLTQFIESKM